MLTAILPDVVQPLMVALPFQVSGVGAEWLLPLMLVGLLAMIVCMGVLTFTRRSRHPAPLVAAPAVVSSPAALRPLRRAVMRWEDDGGDTGPSKAAQPPLAAVPLPRAPSKDGLQELIYPPYRAVVTAHFPDRPHRMNAQQRLAAVASHMPGLAVQWFDGRAADGSGTDPEGEQNEFALLIHLEDGTRGSEIIRICQEAGATRTSFYPARSVARTQENLVRVNRTHAPGD